MRRTQSLEALVRWSRTLSGARVRGKALPRLFFFTDPARVPEPIAPAAALPRGAGVVYRAFGASDGLETGRRLRRVADRGGLLFLVGADPGLASRLRADGVHMPERLVARIPGLRRAHPAWVITCAAHSAPALAAARRFGADAVFLSPVFESRSPSAGQPLGSLRFAALAHGAGLPVFALGGVNAKTARALAHSDAAGLAAVEALGQA